MFNLGHMLNLDHMYLCVYISCNSKCVEKPKMFNYGYIRPLNS